MLTDRWSLAALIRDCLELTEEFTQQLEIEQTVRAALERGPRPFPA